MRHLLAGVVVFSIACGTAFAETGFVARPLISNLFQPTGYTLHKEEFAVGLGPIAFGITENTQLGTNLLLWLFQVYNADLKVSLAKDHYRALAAGLRILRFSWDVKTDDGEKGNVGFLGVGPYVAASLRLGESTVGHISGQYVYFEADENVEDAKAEASSSGTSVFGGIEYSMSYRTKFLVDAGYDATFEGARFGGGVVFGWKTFRLKLGVSYYSAGPGFVLPNVGLWWRFLG